VTDKPVRTINFLSRIMNYMAMGVLVLMMLLTVSDVLMRFLFRNPIMGSTELIEVMMAVVVFLALAWGAVTREHLKVDLLISHLSPRVQAIVDSITMFMGLGMVAIITWRSFLDSMDVQTSSALLKFPMYPFHWIMTLGFAVLCLAMVPLFIRSVVEAVKR